jgi:hypothetical protein
MNLTRRAARSIIAGIILLNALAACTDVPSRATLGPASLAVMTSVNGQGTFSDFDPLPNQASCVTPPSTLGGFAAYQPFIIPAGYSQTIIFDEVGDFTPVAGSGANLPDMNTLNETGPHAGRYSRRISFCASS